ncbi:MAG TPA: amidohydrolase family protein [Bryobacteraceae bacterium]|nr:amidohydrolase family protein [Bryobacteraceae bacterium]
MTKDTRSLLFVFLCLSVARPALAALRGTLVIKHVTVIDATGDPAKPDQTVVVTGDRIAAIADSARIRAPKNAQTVDATGKFLIPGLWDMHVHPIDKDYLPLFLANGVTGVRVMWGQPAHREWRKAIEAGQMLGPRLVIASPIVDGPRPYWFGSISVTNETQARQVVADMKRQGADFVKIYQNLPRELYFAIAEEAKKQGIPFEGHVPIAVSAEEASNAGQKSFEHLVGILPACSTHSDELLKAQHADLAQDIAEWGRPKFWGPHVKQTRQMMLDTYSLEKAAELFALLRRNGTWQCPTLTLLHMFAYGDDPAVRNDPRLKYLPRLMRASWDPSKVDGEHTPEDFAFAKREFQKDLEAVGAMQRAGVGILAGTDTANPLCYPGFGLHEELRYLVKSGLTPMQALQTATLNPARFFAKEEVLGTVEQGKIADLVLLDANPLEDIENTTKIAAVVQGGKLYPRPSLDQMLAEVESAAARLPISDALFKTIQEKDVGAAVQQYRQLSTAKPPAYDFSESEFIGLGYRLIGMKRYKEAIEIFKLSVEAYPLSYNTYDSLAEAYMDNGDKELAIKNYEKSLQLNPYNANGQRRLKILNTQ